MPPALVAEVGLAPGNLRVAAGLGITDLIRELDGPPPRGRAAASTGPTGASRRGVRPTTLPRCATRPSWAARSDQADAIDALVALGADPGRDVYRGTPLAWAAALGRTAALRRLLDLGVDPWGAPRSGAPTTGRTPRRCISRRATAKPA